jgi:hypothetical protein
MTPALLYSYIGRIWTLLDQVLGRCTPSTQVMLDDSPSVDRLRRSNFNEEGKTLRMRQRRGDARVKVTLL